MANDTHDDSIAGAPVKRFKSGERRMLTAEEARERFLTRVLILSDTISKVPGLTAEQRAERLALDMLGLIDGSDLDFCGMQLVLAPPADELSAGREGEGAFEAGQVINEGISLSEKFFEAKFKTVGVGIITVNELQAATGPGAP